MLLSRMMRLVATSGSTGLGIRCAYSFWFLFTDFLGAGLIPFCGTLTVLGVRG